MAKVPTYDELRIGANTLPGARIDSSGTAAIGGVAAQQAQQMGEAVQGLGQTGGLIAADMQREANQLRVIDASNQAKEQMFNLLYDKDNGALNQKGWNALNRESGKDLPTEYGDKFSELTAKMSAALGNDEQRRMFSQHVASMHTQMRGMTMQHQSQEFNHFQVSTYDGTVATAQNEIALMGGSGNITIDPETKESNIDSALGRIEAATRQKARLAGLSQVQADVEVKKLQSQAHVLAVEKALQDGKIEHAANYFDQYVKTMDAQSIFHVKGKLDGEVNNRIGVSVASEVVRKMQPRIQTGDAERIYNIMLGTESGGKHFAAGGAPLTSPKGATGIAQVMPTTAPEAAKLAGLEWKPEVFNRKATGDAALDKEAADYNKALGMAYFQKQLQTNGGDFQKAMAAYNAGPGALEEAIKKADKSVKLNKTDPTVQVHTWFDFLPKETKEYVTKNSKAFEAGQGAPARPTFAEIDDQLRADPRLANSPARYKVAREEASRQFEEQTKAIKQKDEDAVAGAMRAVVENGGRYSDLPASIRGSIPPKEVDNVIAFAQKISKGDDTTSLYLYNSLTTHPEQLARLSDNQFYALRRELSESDFKHFSNERAKLTGAVPGSQGPGDLNTSAIKQTLDARLRMLQIDPTPKDDGGSDAARVGGLRQFIDRYFYAAQREAGKKFNDAEVSAHIDALFAKNTEVRGWFSTSSSPMLGIKAGDIPSADKDGIKAAFKRMGVDSPTDAQILNAYWTMKVARR